MARRVPPGGADGEPERAGEQQGEGADASARARPAIGLHMGETRGPAAAFRPGGISQPMPRPEDPFRREIDHGTGALGRAGPYDPGMPQDPDPLALAADFPNPTREEWRALVAAVLAKSGVTGDPEDALASLTYDGIRIKPLYTPEDGPALDAAGLPGHPPFVRGATAGRCGGLRVGRPYPALRTPTPPRSTRRRSRTSRPAPPRCG